MVYERGPAQWTLAAGDGRGGSARRRRVRVPELPGGTVMEIHNRLNNVIYISAATDLRAALIEAVVRGADLGGADLRGADLRGTDLRGTDLGGADLRGADLGGADLRGADL